jgi:hypothetical protein
MMNWEERQRPWPVAGFSVSICGKGLKKPRKTLLTVDGHRNGGRTVDPWNIKQGCCAPGDIFLPLACVGGTKEQSKDIYFVMTVMASSAVLRIDMYCAIQ